MTAVLEAPQATTITPAEAPTLELTFPVTPVVDRHPTVRKTMFVIALAIAAIVAGLTGAAVSLVLDGTLSPTTPVITTQNVVFQDVASADSKSGELVIDTTAGPLTATQAQVDMMTPNKVFMVTIQSNSDGTAGLIGAPVPVDD